jgi:hypothetical protein
MSKLLTAPKSLFKKVPLLIFFEVGDLSLNEEIAQVDKEAKDL